MGGIRAVRPGGIFTWISGRAIQTHAESNGFSVVRDFVGHGIGEHFHMDPQVPHYLSRHAKDALLPGMVFTIEPMINEGDWRHRLWSDNWTAVTVDGGRSAQFEHTVRVTETGVEVLTARSGQQSSLPSKSERCCWRHPNVARSRPNLASLKDELRVMVIRLNELYHPVYEARPGTNCSDRGPRRVAT